KLYYAYNLNVTFSVAGQNVADISTSDENNRYFAHFKDPGPSEFRARMYVTGFPGATSTTGPNFTLGISPASIQGPAPSTALDPAHPEVKWGSGLTFGTTYR